MARAKKTTENATLEEVRKHGHVLTPGRYVGAEAQADDGEPFDERMKRLTATLREQLTTPPTEYIPKSIFLHQHRECASSRPDTVGLSLLRAAPCPGPKERS